LKDIDVTWAFSTFAALALATDPATPDVLDRKPDRKTAPLISIDMWKMILAQSLFQLAVALILHFAGDKILGFGSQPNSDQRVELNTLVFNAFVWCQICASNA
jgi:Ca2+-transporting ATPase